jgi:uncharacterized protein
MMLLDCRIGTFRVVPAGGEEYFPGMTPDSTDATATELTVIGNCDACAACCRRTPIPPFQPGEEAARNVPDELLRPVQERISADRHFDLLPCVWLDLESLRCRHYDLRPQACRDFEVGGMLCRLSRWDEGVDRG